MGRPQLAGVPARAPGPESAGRVDRQAQRDRCRVGHSGPEDLLSESLHLTEERSLNLAPLWPGSKRRHYPYPNSHFA